MRTSTPVLHPGWYRFGPVGGIGAAIALGGFVTTAMLRLPLLLPVFAAALLLGCGLAVVLRRRNDAKASNDPILR
jgi:hypothetical protein